jgi:hypothetical protein
MARALGTRSKFFVAYLLLGAAVGSAIGAFIVVVQRPGPKPPPPWSSWRPGSSALQTQVLEIADHIGSAYRLPSGDPLTAVKLYPRGSDLRAIGIPTVRQPKTLNDFKLYDQSSSVIYVLCGLGPNCSINKGKPTVARGTMLRREALELALYTMEYARAIDNVLVFFPAARGEKTLTRTLFFHRSDLESHLKHPLRRTLPQAQPPLPGRIRPAEKQTVDQLTRPTFYLYVRTVGVQGYGSMVVLEPPTTGSSS